MRGSIYQDQPQTAVETKSETCAAAATASNPALAAAVAAAEAADKEEFGTEAKPAHTTAGAVRPSILPHSACLPVCLCVYPHVCLSVT